MSPGALDRLTKPIATYYSSISQQRPLHYPVTYLLALLSVSPCCHILCHSSPSALASPCSAVVCSPIHNNSSEEHLAVSFTSLTTRLPLLLMTLPFCIFPLPSSKTCKSLLKKIYVDLFSILFLLLILPLNLPLTLSLRLTLLPNRVYPIVTAPIYQETSS